MSFIPANHNLYPDPNNPKIWIHSLVPIKYDNINNTTTVRKVPQGQSVKASTTKKKQNCNKNNNSMKLPNVANTSQNRTLNINGQKKISRCSNCTKPIKLCSCSKFSMPVYYNSTRR